MFLAFGEIMLRVTPPGLMRFRQALPGPLDCSFGGGEANVCCSLALLGRKTRYLTALPGHAIAESLIDSLRALGIDTDCILRRDAGRLGIYFLEGGANQRGSSVLYDRHQSAVSLAAPEEYDFQAALRGVDRLHVTGITPSLSENAFRSTLGLVQLAKSKGVSVSCDLNFRKKLWRWRPGTDPQALARECMSQILPQVDLAIGNEEDAEKVLGICAKGSSVEEGRIDPEAYKAVARQIHALFPNLGQVAITLRQSISASHNNWGAMLFEARANKTFFAPLDLQGDYRPYEIRNIVDRVGAGDSFAAGLIYALDSDEFADSASAVAFAAAASCLKHSIPGDLNYATLDEIRALAAGQASGRVQRSHPRPTPARKPPTAATQPEVVSVWDSGFAILTRQFSGGACPAMHPTHTTDQGQAMKTIGLIGGMSWESSIEYYRIINLAVQAKLGGLHSARCIMYSVDFADIEPLQQEGRWPEAAGLLIAAARNLQRGGADFLVLCTNTMHKLADQIEKHVQIPLLHIADATARAIKSQGIGKVGLLGTRFTMEEEFYQGRLTDQHAIEVLVPNQQQRAIVHRVIYDELCRGRIEQSSKQQHLAIIDELANRGAEGVILGCTEIGLLVKAEDSRVPLFDTTKIHAEAAVAYALEA